MPFNIPSQCELGTYLNVSMLDGKGNEVGMSQHKLSTEILSIEISGAKTDITEDEERFYIEGKGFSYIFNKHYGIFESIVKNGKEMLKGFPRITVWRAPTDNDRHIKKKWGLIDRDNWMGENMNRQFTKVYSVALEGNTITVSGSLSGVARMPFIRHEIKYSFYEKGEIKVSVNAKKREDLDLYLPRYGFEFLSPVRNDNFIYYGMGECECYLDMCHHAKVGMYSSDAESEYIDYIMPQEHGNHIKTKLLKMGSGLTFMSDGEFEFNVSEYTSKALTDAMHTDELKKSDGTNIRIDYKVSGIGSQSCGPELHKKYQLSEKVFNFEFYIM